AGRLRCQLREDGVRLLRRHAGDLLVRVSEYPQPPLCPLRQNEGLVEARARVFARYPLPNRTGGQRPVFIGFLTFHIRTATPLAVRFGNVRSARICWSLSGCPVRKPLWTANSARTPLRTARACSLQGASSPVRPSPT